MGLAAGVITAGVIGAGASLATGAMQAGAAKDASNAQVNEANKSLALQQQEFNQTQANLSPYMQVGPAALTQYQNLAGGNGTAAQTSAIQALQNNPLYLAETGAGNQAILANASATGGLRSGNANYNLAQFNANTLANVYQQQLGNLYNLVGTGENAAAGLGGFAANYANSAANTLGNIGSAQAGGVLGSANALGGGINGGISQALQGYSMSRMLNGYSPIYPGASTIGAPVSAIDYSNVAPMGDLASGFSTDLPVF